MQTNQPRIPVRPLRIAGALASAAAVALLGTGVLAPSVAMAAGAATGNRVPVPPPAPVADPAALTTTSSAGEVVTYRVRSGQLERV